jgi:membrane carboxypeptidase/penicillin-binding protein
MVNAYSALADNGLQHDQSLIDFIQDRNGKVIWRDDERSCTGCNMPEWDGKPMPRLSQRGRQVLDARTAYQVVHMLEGVIIRGTGWRCATWPASVRQDRHHHGPDQCVVRGRIAGHRGRCLSRL